MPKPELERPDPVQALRDRAVLISKCAKDAVLRSSVWGACYHDPVFFIENFCYADDGKGFYGLGTPAVPFLLFEFQKELVREVVQAIEDGEPIVIEKSRQMGASWCIAAVFAWGFIFRNWKLKMISRNGDEVDKLGAIDSFIEKVRFMIRFMPDWILPRGFDTAQNMTHMLISRPDGTGIIKGETANANASRGGTYDAILLDEFAFITHAEAINAAAMFASKCVIYNSTPQSEFDEYYRMRKLALSGKIRGLRYHWSEHPFYTQEWYEREKERIGDPVRIARELDIDYAGSVEGRIYPNFRPLENGGDLMVGEFSHVSGRKIVVSIDHAHGAGENTDPNAVTVWELPGAGTDKVTLLLACEFQGDPIDCAHALAGRTRLGYALNNEQSEFLGAFRLLPAPIAWVGDPYDSNSSLFSTTIAKEYAKVGITLVCPSMKRDPESRILRTRSSLRRMRCDSRTTPYMMAMSNAKYKKRAPGASMERAVPDHDGTSHYRTSTEYFWDWFLDEEARLTRPAARSIWKEVANPLTGELERKEFKTIFHNGQ